MNAWAELHRVGARRHGVVCLDDARACGISASTLKHRADAEGWQRLARGVWALPGSAPTPWREHAAALTAASDEAVLARRSAGWLWGLRPAPAARVELLTPFPTRATRQAGVTALRSRSLRRQDVTTRAGFRVTTAARTLGDLASVSSVERLVEMVVAARQRGLVVIADVVEQVAIMRNTPGIPRLREAVMLLDGEHVDSMLERDVRRGLRAAGFPPPVAEPIWLGTGPGCMQFDIAWPQWKVAIEVDGFAYHHTAEDLARDHRKANVAAAQGWVLLRVGYLAWRTARQEFLAELRDTLTLRAPSNPWSLPAVSGRK